MFQKAWQFPPLVELRRGLYWASGLLILGMVSDVIDSLMPLAVGIGYVLVYLLMEEG